jgi:hypothetical protein
MWSTSENLQETAEKNIRPMGENSPNLVALNGVEAQLQVQSQPDLS